MSQNACNTALWGLSAHNPPLVLGWLLTEAITVLVLTSPFYHQHSVCSEGHSLSSWSKDPFLRDHMPCSIQYSVGEHCHKNHSDIEKRIHTSVNTGSPSYVNLITLGIKGHWRYRIHEGILVPTKCILCAYVCVCMYERLLPASWSIYSLYC